MTTVILLKKSTMEVYGVDNGQKTAKAETGWDPDNLVDKLKLIKDKFATTSVRVMVEDEVYSDIVMDTLSTSALQAGLTIETVMRVSEVGGDDSVLELAGKSLDESESPTVEVVKEETVQPVLVQRKTPSRKTLIIIGVIVGILVLLVVVGGILRSRSATMKPSPTPTPTPVVQSTPEPTPVPYDVSKLKVQILNGSGVAGEAGVVQDLLVDGGFTKDNITVGNADNYDYTDTMIGLKPDADREIFASVSKSLVSNYTVTRDDDLKDNSKYDVVIIVGTKK